MSAWFKLCMVLSGLSLTACTSGFVSSWRDPAAGPLEFSGSKVVAVVAVANPVSRRAGEDALVREINQRGAQGIASYQLLPSGSPTSEPEIRKVFESAGVKGVVVMRPLQVEKEVVSTAAPYSSPAYGRYWGGYYGAGWSGTEIRTDTIVSVETLVYSLAQNKLVWAGQSKTTNPSNLDSLIKNLAARVTDELAKQGLIRRQS